MPELPEVETVRRALEGHALNRKVVAVETGHQRLRRPLESEALREQLLGASFTGARRRGKFLLVDVGERGAVMIHLGMSGCVRLHDGPTARAPHTHLVLGFEGDGELHYVAPRRFGFISWLTPEAEARDPSLSRLGVEPLRADLVTLLPPLLRARKGPIKTALMDQALVAGVGNIYACEALWRAKIRPQRAGARTGMGRLEALVGAVQGVLEEAITQGGTTLKDHETPHGDIGMFVQSLEVYGREGEACRRCGGEVRRAVMSGRATFWCPGCQR